MKTDRIIVKIGTSLLTKENGTLDKLMIRRIVKQIAELHKDGRQIIIVSSGAISAGLGKLGAARRPKLIPELQAAAAIGQSSLMHCYEDEFKKYGCLTAQVLLTREDMENRTRYLNVRNALTSLLRHRVVPVINENDTVAVEEIKFGDNDMLSALVSIKMEADVLLILTDVDGLYRTNPQKGKDGSMLTHIEEITPEIETFAGSRKDALRGTGGMHSKIRCAKMVTCSGITLIIANGRSTGIIRGVLEGRAKGTYFSPKKGCLSGKKRWLAFGARVKGILIIDIGAEAALTTKGKSLLPSGIISCEGDFAAGDVVTISNRDKKEIARGISSYSREQVTRIKGRRTGEIESILGRKDYDEVVHRDNMVIMK